MPGGVRRASIPLAIAISAGLLAAWLVLDYTSSVGSVDGETQTVLVANRPISQGQSFSDETLTRSVRTRVVPAAYVPVDAVTDEQELIGLHTVTEVAEGAYITQALITSDQREDRYRLRRGERAVSVDVRAAPDGAELPAGTIVDLVASGLDGAPQSELLLRGAEVLQSTATPGDDTDSRITVRVAIGQVATLIRADVFARELRALRR